MMLWLERLIRQIQEKETNKFVYRQHGNDNECQDGWILQKRVEKYTENSVKALTCYFAGHHIFKKKRSRFEVTIIWN